MAIPTFVSDTMTEDVRSYLITNAGVYGQINDRFYPGVAPMTGGSGAGSRQEGESYAVWTQTGEEGSHHMAKAGCSILARIQIDVYATTALRLKANVEAFRNALDGIVQRYIGSTYVSRCFMVDRQKIYTPSGDGKEIGDFREMLQFEVSYMRSVPGIN